MKRYLLPLAICALWSTQNFAQPTVDAVLFEPEVGTVDERGQLLTGAVTNVSSNGQWAVINDEFYVIGGVWNIDDPFVFTVLPDRGMGFDVSNDGTVVGCYRLNPSDLNTQRPGYYRDGEWHPLPLSDLNYNDGVTSQARAISADGKYIAGQQTIEKEFSEETGGAKVPCLWEYNEGTKEYDLVGVYDDPQIGNQGFWVTCMSEDGNIIGGLLTCGAGSSTIPAIIKDGKLKIWNKLETRLIPYEYKGEVIGYFEYYFIDGHMDNSGYDFMGTFRWYGADGKLYGYRTKVTDIKPDALGDGLDQGTLHINACTYDPETDTFVEGPSYRYYMAALPTPDGSTIYLSSDGINYDNENPQSIHEFFDVQPSRTVGSILYCCDDEGRVFGGGAGEYNEVTGDVDEYPFIIVLEEGLAASVDSLTQEMLDGIDEVYSLDGIRMQGDVKNALRPGIYLYKSGKSCKKILIQ